MSTNLAYELSKSLPNKWLNPDGSVTDGQGNIITPASEAGAFMYQNSKSVVNKFVDVDGQSKTYEQISMDLFQPVDVLPETGEKNKIYLVPAEDGTFDEYYWTEEKGWDILGNVAIDLNDYPTFDQMNAAMSNFGKCYSWDGVNSSTNPNNIALWQEIYNASRTENVFVAYVKGANRIALTVIGPESFSDMADPTKLKVWWIAPNTAGGAGSPDGVATTTQTAVSEIYLESNLKTVRALDSIMFRENDYRYLFLPTNATGAMLNVINFTPTEDMHPATKKYVDDMIINKLGGEY